MRLIGLLFLAGGIAIGLLWPWAQLNFGGRELASLGFGDLRGPVVERQVFSVGESDNPIRIRFQAAYKINANLPPVKIPVKVVITDADGTLLTGVISFPTQGIETGPEQSKVRGSQALNFNAINPGRHELFLELAENENDGGIRNPGLDSITATVIANAPQLRDDYKAFAAVLALAGVYLLLRSRRRKKPNKKNPPHQKWGRGG